MKPLEQSIRKGKLMIDAEGIAHIGTWEWEIATNTISWSVELYRIYGLNPEEYTPTLEAYLAKIHPRDRERVRLVMADVLKSHSSFSHDERIFRPDGSIRHLHTWGHPVLDAKGDLAFLVGVCQDVTELRMTEEMLERSEQLYRGIVESAEEGIWTINEKAETTYVNNKMAEMLGVTVGEMLGRDMYSFMDDEDKAAAAKNMERRRSGLREQHDFTFRKKDGTKVWTRMGTSPIFDETNRFVGGLAVVSDVSQRLRNEVLLTAQIETFERLLRGDTLNEAMETLVLAIESLLDGGAASILLLDRDGERVLHCSAPHLPARYNEVIDGMRIGPANGSCGTAAFRKETVVVTDTYTDPLWADYKTIAVEHGLRSCWSSPIFSHNGVVLGTFAMYFKEQREPHDFEIQLVKNATSAAALGIEYRRTLNYEMERRAQEALLAEAGMMLADSFEVEAGLQKVMELVVSQLADLCCFGVIDENQNLKLLASAAGIGFEASGEKLFEQFPYPEGLDGLPRAVKERKPILYSNVEDEAEAGGGMDPGFRALLRRYGIRSYLAVPILVRDTPLGGLSFLSARKGRFYGAADLKLAGQLSNACGLAVDNSRLYQEAQRSVRLRDDFIAIASHELRTPLTPLSMKLDLLSKILKAPGKYGAKEVELLTGTLHDSQQQIKRLSNLVNNLLDVSRIGSGRLSLRREPVYLGELVAAVVEREKAEIELSKCKVSLDLRSGIRGNWDRLRLDQVVTNLLSNALKFGGGKPIDITVQSEDDWAIFSVADGGAGISLCDQSRIFERFERAGDSSLGGFGLGLFIVKQIVESHGGKISVESAPGKGAKFKVSLPLA